MHTSSKFLGSAGPVSASSPEPSAHIKLRRPEQVLAPLLHLLLLLLSPCSWCCLPAPSPVASALPSLGAAAEGL